MSDKDFYADESKYQRIESLKNQSPMSLLFVFRVRCHRGVS